MSSLPMNQEEVDTLNNIMENMTDCDLDWWAEPYKPEIAVTVLVPPSCMDTMEERYNSAGLQYNVTVEDLQEIIVEEKRYRYVTTLLHRQLGSNWVPDVYHNL